DAECRRQEEEHGERKTKKSDHQRKRAERYPEHRQRENPQRAKGARETFKLLSDRLEIAHLVNLRDRLRTPLPRELPQFVDLPGQLICLRVREAFDGIAIIEPHSRPFTRCLNRRERNQTPFHPNRIAKQHPAGQDQDLRLLARECRPAVPNRVEKCPSPRTARREMSKCRGLDASRRRSWRQQNVAQWDLRAALEEIQDEQDRKEFNLTAHLR